MKKRRALASSNGGYLVNRVQHVNDRFSVNRLVRTAIIVISLTLSACASRLPGNDVRFVSLWHCSNAAFFALYFDEQGAAVISAGSKKYVLPPVASASGTRYAKGDVELQEHQGKATLLGASGGPYRNCTRDAR